MHVHAVEYHQCRDPLREADVQPANQPKAILIRAISDAGIRSDRQVRLAAKVLADRCVERLAGRRADSIRAGAKNERRPVPRFGDGKPVCKRADLPRARIVFDAAGKAGQELVCERGADAGARNLIGDEADTKCPPVLDLILRPADRAALSRSERSTGNR